MKNMHHDKETEVNRKSSAKTMLSIASISKLKLKKQNRLLLALVIFVLFASLAAVLILPKKNSTKDLVPVYGIADATKYESPKALVDAVSAELTGQPTSATLSSSAGFDAQGRAVYKLPPVNVEGKPFKNLTLGGEGYSYTGNEALSESNYAKMVNYLTVNNFKKSSTLSGGSAYVTENDKVPFMSYSVFESPDVICAIWRADISQLDPGKFTTSIGCANYSSYVDTANQIMPFYDAYIAAGNKNNEKNLIFGVPVVTDGTGGYKRATVYQELVSFPDNLEGADQSAGLYYQLPGTNLWKYFKPVSLDADQTLACSTYDTVELRKAFIGFDCLDDVSKKYRTVL